MIFALPKKMCMRRHTHDESVMGSPWNSTWGPSGSEAIVFTLGLYGIVWCRFHIWYEWTWVIYVNNVLSIKTILFDILDFWCQLEEIQFAKTLSKRRMFVSFMKISACWLLQRLITFNKICWDNRPAKPRPTLRTSFCRRDLKNTQPHLKVEGEDPATPGYLREIRVRWCVGDFQSWVRAPLARSWRKPGTVHWFSNISLIKQSNINTTRLGYTDVLVVKKIDRGDGLAREYMPAHQHCGLFKPLVRGLERSALKRDRSLVLRSGAVP